MAKGKQNCSVTYKSKLPNLASKLLMVICLFFSPKAASLIAKGSLLPYSQRQPQSLPCNVPNKQFYGYDLYDSAWLNICYMGYGAVAAYNQMRKVSYLYNEDITKYELSKQHPMKTKRMKMVHSLINNYSLTPQLRMVHSKQATSQEIATFHHPLYVKYLETWVSPKAENIVEQFAGGVGGVGGEEAEKAKIREDSKVGSIFKVNQTFDCPGFEGLYNFCKLAAGGSIDAADLIIAGSSDIVINWSGGYHHAKKTEASGFCYVNDIVLCILELLKVYPRVMYLDIDVHHGDGVEEAFYHTNRVMTVSFHEFDQDFFPGTGSLDSVGEGHGKFYAVNVPLKRGMDDASYVELFKKVMFRVVSSYVPDVMVIQCGADSLSKDKLGHFNLSIKGHGELLSYMKNFGVPMVLLGGGGYTIENVARCWTYETGLMLGHEVEDQIPKHDAFYNYYGSEDNRIHFDTHKTQNLNTNDYLNEILETITENLREADIRPSISFHHAPRHYLPTEELDWVIVDEDQDSMTDEVVEKFFRKL